MVKYNLLPGFERYTIYKQERRFNHGSGHYLLSYYLACVIRNCERSQKQKHSGNCVWAGDFRRIWLVYGYDGSSQRLSRGIKVDLAVVKRGFLFFFFFTFSGYKRQIIKTPVQNDAIDALSHNLLSSKQCTQQYS